MLYLLAQWLHFPGVANLVRYQTFRAGAALATALVMGLIIGPVCGDWVVHASWRYDRRLDGGSCRPQRMAQLTQDGGEHRWRPAIAN